MLRHPSTRGLALSVGLALAAHAPSMAREAARPTAVAPPASAAWSTLATADVDAIHHGLSTLHPALRSADSAVFRARLEGAYATARARAAQASDFQAWREAVTGFILAFRDGHTFIRLEVQPTRARWPGFLIDGRGGGWVATAVTGEVARASGLQGGDRLMSCDGVPIARLLEERLDGRVADWSKAPERIRQAWRLFVDYRLEGPAPLASCTFARGPATGGSRIDVKLGWLTVPNAELTPRTLALLRTPPTRPIRLDWAADGGAIVRVGSVGDEGALTKLEASMKAQVDRLRAAPYIVFDMRGDRGGNSSWGATLGSVLWGEEAVAARARPVLGKDFRASSEAIEQYRALGRRFEADGPDMAGPARYWLKMADRVAASPDGDNRLFQDYGPQPPATSKAVPLPVQGKVFVLTDAGCFSSCVVAADSLRLMGAIQVGEPTGRNEEYGEVAGPLPLPSGLGAWWSPLSIIHQQSEGLGGLPVDVAWDGALDDDEHIFPWIAGLARNR